MTAPCWCVFSFAPVLLALTRRRTQAVASSYTYEEGDKDHPPDAVFVRPVVDAEVLPKQRAAA